LLVAAAALACLAERASAAEPAAAPASADAGASAKLTRDTLPPSPAAPGVAPALPGTQSVAPAWRHAWEVTAGLGFYERASLGVAYRPSPRSSVGLFAGTDFGAGDASVNAVGLSYARALAVLPAYELGWDLKSLYWAQYSPDYNWKILTLVGGGYLARDLRPGLRLVLDAGAAVNLSMDTVRKQNVNFEYPTRWTASFALALQYRFKAW
jgi:hypothetical protein